MRKRLLSPAIISFTIALIISLSACGERETHQYDPKVQRSIDIWKKVYPEARILAGTDQMIPLWGQRGTFLYLVDPNVTQEKQEELQQRAEAVVAYLRKETELFNEDLTVEFTTQKEVGGDFLPEHTHYKTRIPKANP